ncbi:MAG: hypothetical protein HY361_01470, partial [Candidatus Aenigmarchaeota archaeon]|nr:hypothetical protein [Candidatus Aenigmarchaeota archaeon]
MSNLLLREIDSSIYNVEIILSLLNKEKVSPYKLAKLSGKQLSQKQFRKSCRFLEEKGIISLSDEKDKS